MLKDVPCIFLADSRTKISNSFGNFLVLWIALFPATSVGDDIATAITMITFCYIMIAQTVITQFYAQIEPLREIMEVKESLSDILDPFREAWSALNSHPSSKDNELPGQLNVDDEVYSLVLRFSSPRKKENKSTPWPKSESSEEESMKPSSHHNNHSSPSPVLSSAPVVQPEKDQDIEMNIPSHNTTTALDAIDIATSSAVSPSSPTTPASAAALVAPAAAAAAADLVAPAAPVPKVIRGDKGKVIGKCLPLSTLRLKVSIDYQPTFCVFVRVYMLFYLKF